MRSTVISVRRKAVSTCARDPVIDARYEGGLMHSAVLSPCAERLDGVQARNQPATLEHCALGARELGSIPKSKSRWSRPDAYSYLCNFLVSIYLSPSQERGSLDPYTCGLDVITSDQFARTGRRGFCVDLRSAFHLGFQPIEELRTTGATQRNRSMAQTPPLPRPSRNCPESIWQFPPPATSRSKSLLQD